MRRLLPFTLSILITSGAWAQTPVAPVGDLPPQTIALTSLSAFRPTTSNWKVAGGASADRTHAAPIATEAGTGVLVNTPVAGAQGHLLTTWEHGDLDLSLDVMLPKGSNSGIYLMGRYEVTLFDSWGVRAPTAADLGGIYQRWDEKRGAGREGYEGTPPRLNASRAPGLWQHVVISFRAPRFAGKTKIANARFAQVSVNGAVVQENVEVTGPTRGAVFADERPTGPLLFQGDHGSVAMRNIQYKSYSSAAKLTDLTYRTWVGEGIDTTWMATRPPTRQGPVASLSSDPAGAPNKFAIAYDGSLTVPVTGRYRITSNINWVGTEEPMQGPAVARAQLSLDGKPVLTNLGAAQRVVQDVDLTAGKHAFALTFYKNRQYGNERDVQLWIEGPGMERQSLHDESLLTSFGNPINPIMVEPQGEPALLRGFMRHRGVKHVYVMSVGDPTGVHYSYDLSRGSPFYVWRGPFIETTQMWDGRGEDQISQPSGSVVDLADVPTLAFLSDANAAWPDSIIDERQFSRKGFVLDKAGRPTFLSEVRGVLVEDEIRPDPDGATLRRELRLRAPVSASTEGLYVQLAQGTHIARQSDGTYAVDDKTYFITLPAGAAPPIVRQQNGHDELLILIRFDRGEARVAYSIVW
ncbi:MAG: DUF1080 domain-containing protein [bacterium]